MDYLTLRTFKRTLLSLAIASCLSPISALATNNYLGVNTNHPSDSNYQGRGATGTDAITLGKSAKAENEASISIGHSALTKGSNSLAIGRSARVGNSSSLAINNSVAIGYNSSVNINNSIALGYNSSIKVSDVLSNKRSYFLENHSSDNLNDSGQGIVSVGTSDGNIKRRIIGVAGGYNDYDAANVKQVKSAVRYISIQSDNTGDLNYDGKGATGLDAIAIGKRASSVAREGLSFGVGARTNGESSIAIGSGALVGETTTTHRSIAFGQNAKANLQNSLALGYNSVVQTADVLAANTHSYFLENHGSDVLNDSGQGIVSFGTANGGIKRRLIGVAGGYNDYDAANVKQVKSAVRYISFKSDNTADANYYRNGATGADSIAIGKGASSAGGESLSFGIDAQAKEQGSLAIGRSAISHKQYGLTLGYQAATREVEGVALGRGAATHNQKSIALGSGSQDQNYNQNSRGAFLNHNPSKINQYTENNDKNNGVLSIGNNSLKRRIIHLAAGSDNTDAVNVEQLTYATRYYGVNTPVDTNNPNYRGKGASGEYAIAIGSAAQGKGRFSLAVGDNAIAMGEKSVALGYGAQAKLNGGVAIGDYAIASNANSVALGRNSVDESYNQNTRGIFLNAKAGIENDQSESNADITNGVVSIGHNGLRRRIVHVAGGAGDYDAANIRQLTYATRYYGVNSHVDTNNPNYRGKGASGTDAIAIGRSAEAKGTSAVSIGDGAIVSAEKGVALGYGAKVHSNAGIAIGDYAIAHHRYSVSLGFHSQDENYTTNTKALFLNPNAGVVNNHSEENADVANGVVSLGNGSLRRRILHVAGGANDYEAANIKQLTYATRYYGVNSHVEPNNANYRGKGASGADAIAIGRSAEAKGSSAVSIGDGAIVSAEKGVALGYGAKVHNNAGIAIGDYAIAHHRYSVSLGFHSQDENYTTNTKALFLNPNAGVVNNHSEENADVANGVVSLGNGSLRRRILHVAGGANDYEAANIKQLTYATRYYGVNSHVEPNNANYRGKGATGVNAIAIGSMAQAKARFSIAFGDSAIANNAETIAIGHSARVSSDNALAIGSNAVSEAKNSIALGFNSAVMTSDLTNDAAYLSNESVNDIGNGVLSVGKRGQFYRRIVGVAGGTHDNDAVNVKQLKAVHLKFQGDDTTKESNQLPSIKFDNEDLSIVGAGSGEQKFITTKAYGNKVEIDLSDKVKALLKGDAHKLGYKVNSVAGQPVDLSTGLNFVAATDTNQATDTPKKGIELKDKANGQIEFGLDKDTYTKIQNTASKDDLATKENKITRGNLNGNAEISVTGAGKLIDSDLSLSLKEGAIAESKLNDALKQKINLLETVEGSGSIQVASDQTNTTGGKKFVVSLKVDELINELTNASAGLKFKGNTDPTISKTLGQTLVIKGETSENSTALESAADNLFVVANNDELVIKLAKALKGIQSIASEAKVDGKAATTVSLTENGVEIATTKAGETTPHKIIIGKDGKITGLEKGTVSDTSTDAINGGQLNALLVKLGKFTIQNGTVTLEIPALTSVADADKNPATMSDAITALDKALGNVANNIGKASFSYKANGGSALTTTLDTGLNFVNGTNTVTTVAEDGVVTVDVAKSLKGLTSVETVDNGNKSTLTAQGLQTEGNGHSSNLTNKSLTFNNGNNQPTLVVDGENRRITGLAPILEGATDAEKLANLNKLKADKATEKLNSAASVSDLAAIASAMTNQGLSFEGDDKQKIDRTLGSTLKLTGEGDLTGDTAAGNLKVEKNATNDGLEIKLAKDLVDLSSAVFKKDGDQTKLDASGVTVGDPNSQDNKANAQLTKQGLTINGKDGKSVIGIGGKDQNGETKPEIAFAKDDDGKGTGIVSGLKDLDDKSDGSLAANKNYVDKKVQDINELVDKGLTFGADDKQGKQALGSTLEVKSAKVEIKKGEQSFVGKNLTTSYTTDNAGNGTISVALNERPEFKEVTLKSDDSKSATKVGTIGLEISDEKGDKTTLVHNKLHFANNKGVVDGLQDVADDADGSTAINKNYVDHIQNNVPFEYADSETGKKLVYVDYVSGDGKAINGYYAVENVRPNGKLKPGVELASAVDDEKVVLRPANNRTRIISNVKAGEKDTDAVNVKQLKDVKAEGLNFAGNDTAKGDEVHRDLGQTLTIKGEENTSGDKFNSTTTATGNIKVEADKTNHTLSIKLSDKLKGLKSVTTESDKGSAEMTGEGLTIKDKQGDVKVAIKSGATPLLEFARDKDGNGSGMISGLKAPTKADDAVNKRYVDQLQQNHQKQIMAIDNRVTQLAKDVNSMNRDLRAGIAGATAIANLPQALRQGQSMGSIAVGSYRGQSSVAVGLSRVSDNGNISFKASGSADTQGHINIGAGVGWAW
ncbi:putative autotransporter YadA-like, C-terminal domain protein [Pasteurella multocida]|nr:putative autotransporter YadA-like, C-terminal domain protein [Pasteurella multocida]